MKHFSRSEFACNCGCGFNTVDYELAVIVDDVREYFGQRTTVNSGCRCETHNKDIGGSEHSQHLLGRAADIVVDNVDAHMVSNYLNNKYEYKYGIGTYKGFTHVDSRSMKSRWSGE